MSDDWGVDEAVDGAGLPLLAHAKRLAERLALTADQTDTLVAELRNALIPATVVPKFAPKCIGRVLALADAVAARGTQDDVLIYDTFDGVGCIRTDGQPTECIEAMLRAARQFNQTIAVVNAAALRVPPDPISWRDFSTAHFAEAATTADGWLRAAESEIGKRAASLAEFVQLPTEFVDEMIAEWEKRLRERPIWADGRPRVDEQERIAIIKKAVADHRAAAAAAGAAGNGEP